MYVIGGSASTALAERVSRELGNTPFGVPFIKRFPDGELYLRVGGRLEGEDVVLIQSTRTDQDLLELLLLEDAIRAAGARGSSSWSRTSPTNGRTAFSFPASRSARTRWPGTSSSMRMRW